MEDISKAIDSLREMMNSPQGQESLNSLMKGMTSSSEEGASDPLSNLGNYGNLLSTLQGGTRAPRMQLMSALKPYLSSRRQQKFDIIMNLMRYSDLPSSLFGKGFKR
ncbi:MAG: hypothetical protein PHE51_05820 [Eubacteriales bacterium]|nr:hypothetical protein [Eubacteriales bacterium]